MEKRLIKKETLAGIIGKLAGTMRVFAPMQAEDQVLFRILEAGETPLTDFANTRNAPKNFLFPRTETLMKFTRTGKGMVQAGGPEEGVKTLLFGVRPCDARSFTLLDMLFDQEKYRDPYYLDKRAKTTVVAIACVHPPYTTCFCTSVGGKPVDSVGVDLLLTDLGEEYLAEFITPIAVLGEQMTKFTTEIGFKGFQNPDEVGAAAVDYLRVAGHLVFGYFWARMAQVALRQIAAGNTDNFYLAKLQTARFYFAKLFPETATLMRTARAGSKVLMDTDAALL